MSRVLGHDPTSPEALPEAPSPREEGGGAPEIDRENPGIGLRLAIGRDGLGLELARPATFECLDVAELVIRLPHVRFPFDVSGGVAKFRHKRGELERLTVELDTRRFSRWAERKLRGLVSTGPCSVAVDPRRLGVTLTVFTRRTPSSPETSARVSALAFDVSVVPSGDDVVLVVHGARGANLDAPATTLAMRAVSALVGEAAKREGSRFLVSRPAARLVRRLLPEAGVRAPGGDDVRLMGSGEADGVMLFAFARNAAPIEIAEGGALAYEASLLVRTSDDARFAGDLDKARAYDLAALERAPRHPEVVRRIAEIDALAGGRAEAALASLRDAAGSPHVGLLAGKLLLETGDVPSALAALLREAERDRSNVIGALAYAAAADATTDAYDALDWLDAGIARAPLLVELRWERARRRLAVGRLDGARADLQELEAMAEGARERREVLRRGADLYRAAGAGDAAAELYERALLYSPDDPAALAGLGAAIAREGRAARGAALLAHAIELGAVHGIATSWMELELGAILGEQLRDKPAAIARLRAIPDDAMEAIAARGLEGRLRASLGDFAGASLAFARLRERAGHEAVATPWLVEATDFESSRGDLHAAQRHAGAALAIEPRNEALLALYRDLGERIAGSVQGRTAQAPNESSGAPFVDDDRHGRRLAPFGVPGMAATAVPAASSAPRTPLPVPQAPAVHAPVTHELAAGRPAEPEPAPAVTVTVDPGLLVDEARAEERIESLTRAIQADPTNDAAVDELVLLLSHFGRGMELLALLSARLEDAPPERREALLPKHREVLALLEQQAREAGRDGEADLFKMAREMS